MNNRIITLFLMHIQLIQSLPSGLRKNHNSQTHQIVSGKIGCSRLFP